MCFEWDPIKAAANLQKHGIGFEDASAALYDPLALTIEDDLGTEARFVTIGRDALDRIVVVVYTWRDDTIRIVSARRATARERRSYVG